MLSFHQVFLIEMAPLRPGLRSQAWFICTEDSFNFYCLDRNKTTNRESVKGNICT